MMASQPTLPTPDEADYIDVDAPLLPQLQSIIMAPAAAATSSPNFHGIDISSVDTQRTELKNVSHNSILHAFLLSRQINLGFYSLKSCFTYNLFGIVPSNPSRTVVKLNLLR
jgi:hypothetical protein